MAAPSVTIDLGNVWQPYKELSAIVDAALVQKDPDALPELEAVLRLHKPDFLSLLKNPAKSPLHRTAVLHAPLDGIAVVGQSSPQFFPQAVVDEALILSDMFDLNELAALELLNAGQQQQPSFPGLTRGLVAVILYYDGRRSVVSALRTLVQAREGRTWTFGLNREAVAVVTKFTNQLKEEGLIMNVLNALAIGRLNVEEEITLLQNNRALGSPRYRKQVTDIIHEIRQCLAEIVFCWACQGTLTKDEVSRVIDDLSKQQGTRGDGSLDSVSLTMLMAVLYVMDVSYLQSAEEVDDRVHQLMVVADPDLARLVHKELLSTKNWEIPGIKAILQFTWAIALRTLSQYSWSIQLTELVALLEDDERFVDAAIESGAFLAVQNLVVCSPTFHQEEFFIKRIHVLVTDFVIMLPLKVKDLRNRGDEMSRIIAAHSHEGIQPPSNLPRHFEHFLGLISELYAKDDLDLELSFEYWCPAETTEDASWISRPPQRQVALYKFVRLAGDLLPAPLFVPYIKMLNSLSGSRACAHQCYTMLKMNSKGSSSHYSIISWDHFFNSLHRYYTNLRCEAPAVTDYRHLYGQRGHPRGITPQEVEGLNAILQLLQTVVKHDDMARIALWENSVYMPAVILLGLVACSVPSSIKASLLLALAAFAHSSDITSNLWQSIEVSQLVLTVKPVSTYQPAGIQMDLLEVETRAEEYPITQAFLTLILKLVSHPLPHNLGAGQRVPGLNPYLQYIEKTIFFPFYTRSYKNIAEKWKIGHLCTEIFVKMLEDYSIPKQDFSSSDFLTSNHPGYTLMVQLLQDNSLLKLVLLVLDEGTKLLDIYASLPGQENAEKCMLSSLKLLDQALQRQEIFLEHVHNSSSSLLVTSLDRLLLGVNPRSGHPDHIVIITKYVTYNAFLPNHTLVALQILEQLCQISQIAQHLVMAFATENKIKDMLVHGFVECLETEYEGSNSQSSERARIHYECQQRVLKLILTCLNHPAPNLAHVLLGFQTQKPISLTVLQDPGILSSPRSCLHSVLAILNRGRLSRGCPLAVYETPALAELAYYLVYVLSSNKDTAQPTLRYLRTNSDFVYSQVQLLPFKPSSHGITSSLLAQQSWLLKTLAVELRVISAHRQRSHIQRLLKLLLEDSVDSTSRLTEQDTLTMSTFSTQREDFSGPVRRKLMCILDMMEFSQEWPQMPVLEFLDPVEIERVMNQCESNKGSGPKLINVTQLHQQVVRDLLTLQGLTSLSQRPLLAQEVHGILQYALQRNKARETVHNKQQLFDAWRQVVEVLFTACPTGLPFVGQKHQVLLEMSQELLAKVCEEGSVAELTAPASGVILILMATLHGSLETGNTTSTFHALSSSLVVTLKGILECLTRSGGRFQRVHINYYGALLNLLQIVHVPKDANRTSQLESTILDRESETERVRREHMDVILHFGQGLMEIICRDACSGHDVTKTLALSALDVMMSLDNSHHWLGFLESKGYLRHVIDSLAKDNLELQQILIGETESLRSLYVFESKFALLIKIAKFTIGAQALMRNGIFVKLSECTCLNLRPERSWPSVPPQGDVNNSSFKYYGQILNPVFKLIHSIVTTLGAKHCEVATQLQQFVSCNRELFASILRDRSNTQHPLVAEELLLVTITMSQICLEDVPSGTLELNPEQQSHLNILQRHLLAMLPKVAVSLLSTKATDATDTQLKVTLLQVAMNILSSCCSTVSQAFFAHTTLHHRILFLPNFVDVSTRERYFASGRDAGLTVSRARPPSLGLLVTLIQYSADQLRTCATTRQKLEQQLQALPSLGAAEINEWLPAEIKTEQMNQKQRELAHMYMDSVMKSKTQEVSLHSYIIESSLYLLWRHLEYFLHHCLPNDVTTENLKITQSDLETLATEMKSMVNDSFFNKLHSIQHLLEKERHKVDFVQALVRRLKRLILLKSK